MKILPQIEGRGGARLAPVTLEGMKPFRASRRKRRACCSLAPALWLLAGCHSRFIDATVQNQTGGAVSPVEVDYPSASFGTELLGANASYRYRFKVLGSGGTKVSWTDSAHREHTGTGPALKEGDEGLLRIRLTPDGASWTSALKQ